MIEFESIQIENFLSIGSANVQLNNQGLVLVRGVNNDSGVSKSNGAGKSAVFEALIWSLFGKTFRGVSGDDIINRIRKKECAVALRFIQNGSPYEVVRFRKSRELGTGLYLERDGKDISKPTIPETQRELEFALGFKYDTLVHSTYFGQTLAHFSSLTDAQQKKILDDLLGLSILPKCLAKVRAAMKEISQSKIQSTTQVEIYEQEIEASKERVKEFQEIQRKQKKEQADELKSLKKRLKYKQGLLDKVQEGLEESEEEYEDDKRDFKKRKNQHRADSVRLSNSSARIRAKIEILLKEQKELHREGVLQCDVINAPCPLDKKRLKRKLKELDEQVEEMKKKHKELRAELGVLETGERCFTTEEKVLEKKLDETKAMQSVTSRLEGEVSSIEKKLKEVEEEAEKASEIDEMLNKERRRLRTKRRKLEALEENLEDNRGKMKLYEFWEEGFGNAGMKSYLLDDVADFLNERASEFTAFLTEGEINIDFQTQKRLKSGETREKFAINIEGQGGKTSYAASSGGERRRIDVCILLALSELTSRQGSLPSLLILDEVFDQLDSAGMERVTRLLQSKLMSQRESVFVITHSDALATQFEKELVVTKENGISSVEVHSQK